MTPLPLPCTPSQNILQSSHKWRDILEFWYPTISLEDGTRAPSEVRITPVALIMFSWASTPSESVFGVNLTINWWMRFCMTLCWKLFAVSRLAIEMVAMNDHASAKSCCNLLWCCWLNSTINWKADISDLLVKKMCSTINSWILLLEMFRKYSTPSRCGFKNRSTINWKSAIEVKATINLNAWKIVGANFASFEIDSPINLMDKLGVIVCASWNGNDGRGLISMMRSFGCRSWESDSAVCISASEFDNGMLAFGLMKVTISRRRLNASLVSKILLTRFTSSDGLAIEKAFDNERSTKSCCNRLWNF